MADPNIPESSPDKTSTSNGTIPHPQEEPPRSTTPSDRHEIFCEIIKHWKNYIILDERVSRAETIEKWLESLRSAASKQGLSEEDLKCLLHTEPHAFVKAEYEERAK
jgi:hypothetical protein